MGGSSVDDDWEFASPSNERTLVLVGRTGNGKSATGNSILLKKAFKSTCSSNGVTSTCEMQSTVLKDGQILNVIDTPGLFDFSDGSKFIGKEIVKCINMAKDGIHAILVVLSLRTRFSKEEEATVNSLRNFFGDKITDYMVVVFTNGDGLEDDETLESYLAQSPEPLKEILRQCENRRVLFNNKARDKRQKDEQVQELLSLVNLVIANNGGKPYTDELFRELKEGARKFNDQKEEVISSDKYSEKERSLLTENMHLAYEEQLKRLTEMVESRLRETTARLEQLLAEEQAARLNAEKIAMAAQKKSNKEISELRESLERAQKEAAELRQRRNEAEKTKCAIL